ncbi:MAG: NAD(P)H-dependent oxidoreductase subunit E [Candidatus Thiodiazotropha sp. (ex Lucinoma aequizonata)]|nr:NAD(P)H-dependent oxidoreductase subunit E [Candidatus Thiodiazotropha sp. (ex Lucinoma aequizonata)]MCU7887577.1 NAD(P)H-dependent oxidoreductase subunit E [Candidatus Thiodiazotropha sp. (ex Lucinoma aequizonata)]MCU7895250.1 NAD(P)H-dependent oxidoreductase subunit E [Candidatus Thiodiazotropha sp. (ex Lucinoma aequizonata)]MCU7900469.1 NAD(P)H-dependent oxidoreductase subunit E [Candidatus Thiodiazotropha sp. (ex Lucinoma aequizonata)]MCU7902718.1 NAD(P)H-dependent oxidoreductase subunit
MATTVKDKTEHFTPEVRAEIDRWVAKYPAEWKQSAVMGALMIVQDENGGWLTNQLMDQVAAYLDMPSIAVYEVATFYSMYELKPVGKHKICVCTNVSCMTNKSDVIVEHLEKKLGIGFDQVTEDDYFSLKKVECLGACGGAPMMQIGKQYYENLTPEIVDAILEGLE